MRQIRGYEFNLYKIERELKFKYPELHVVALLIDIACTTS